MAERYCKVCGGWHDLDRPWPDNCKPEVNWNQADFATPMLITDAMPPVMSMVDGKMYDSKAAIRATYKPSGNREGKEYVELGNDPQRFNQGQRVRPDRKKIREAVQRAAVQHSYGRRPDTSPAKTH